MEKNIHIKPGGYLTAEYSFMKLLMKVINYILKKKNLNFIPGNIVFLFGHIR